MILVRDYLEKVSGTTSKLLFQILEAITKQGTNLHNSVSESLEKINDKILS